MCASPNPLSDPELAQRIRIARHRKEVTRLEGLVDLPPGRLNDASWELREAIKDANVYLDKVRKDCLAILKGKGVTI